MDVKLTSCSPGVSIAIVGLGSNPIVGLGSNAHCIVGPNPVVAGQITVIGPTCLEPTCCCWPPPLGTLFRIIAIELLFELLPVDIGHSSLVGLQCLSLGGVLNMGLPYSLSCSSSHLLFLHTNKTPATSLMQTLRKRGRKRALMAVVVA